MGILDYVGNKCSVGRYLVDLVVLLGTLGNTSTYPIYYSIPI